MDLAVVLNLIRKVEVNNFIDSRGNLDVVEISNELNFHLKRMYYISNVPNEESRGGHAHKTLQQIFFAVAGSFTINVFDGESTYPILIEAHKCGYYLADGLWRELTNFSPNAVCLVLASQHYNFDDYIFNKDEYTRWKKEQ